MSENTPDSSPDSSYLHLIGSLIPQNLLKEEEEKKKEEERKEKIKNQNGFEYPEEGNPYDTVG